MKKIKKSVKDEKIKSYYKPLLFVNIMFYIYSIKCLVDLWRSQTSNNCEVNLYYLYCFGIFLFDYNGLIDYLYYIFEY